MSEPLCLPKPQSHRMRYLIPLALVLIVAFALMIPERAYAINIFSSVDDIIQELIIDGILVPICETMLNLYVSIIELISVPDILTASLDDMFGNSTGASSLYTLVTNLHDSVVVPIAHSILALVMLVQLVKISQRIDSTATMPAVKEILFLVVFCAMFMWLINNSVEILTVVYNQINVITQALGNQGDLDLTITLGDTSNLTVGTAVGLLAGVVVAFIFALIALVICYVTAYLRSLQLYIYLAFAPIPLAFLGFEETRSFGVNFCKNFIALCLAGAIMLFVLIAFPYLAANVVATDVTMVDVMGSAGIVTDTSSLIIIVKLIAILIVLAYTMFKSGALARDILGG